MKETLKTIITAIIIAILICVAIELFFASVDYIGAVIGLTSTSEMVMLSQLLFYLLLAVGMFVLDRI